MTLATTTTTVRVAVSPASLDLRDGQPIEPGTSGDVAERARLEGEPIATQPATVATDGGTTAIEGVVVITEIHADAAGDDRENLNDEYFVFENRGTESVDLSGWMVRDEAEKTYAFSEDYTLEGGDSVTLHTGSGTDTDTDLYWGAGSPVWNNDGDTVFVHNSKEDLVLQETYQ